MMRTYVKRGLDVGASGGHEAHGKNAARLAPSDEGLGVLHLDLAHLCLRHLLAALADANGTEADRGADLSRRGLHGLGQLVHVRHHDLTHLGHALELIDLPAIHYHHLPHRGAGHQQVHDLPSHIAR
jgi:hypothetical protein